MNVVARAAESERVKIQGEAQVIGLPVRDAMMRPVGRLVAVVCDGDPYTANWFVLRLRWWRGLRAVPARTAHWTATGLQVPFTRVAIRDSSVLPAPDLTGFRSAIEVHYGLVRE